MTENNFVYYEGATISKTKSSYKVYFEDNEWTIYVSFEDVHKVSSQTNEDDNLIAVLLASITYAREDVLAFKNKVPKVPKEKIFETVIKLLNEYEGSIETLITQLQGMKWHELREILLSEEPVKVLNEII